jgi:sporulation-control protein
MDNMFKKLLASVGIGNAAVDTILLTETLLPGNPFNCEIQIQGGNVEQTISGIDLYLMTQIKVETEEGKHHENLCLAQWRIQDTFTLAAQEKRIFPFHGTLPFETPITKLSLTNHDTNVWLSTELNIDMGLDSSDKDLLLIHPTAIMQQVIKSVESHGFVLKKADVEKGFLNGGHFQSISGGYQELEFSPAGWGFSRTQEIELSFVSDNHCTHLLVELDRRFVGDSYKSLTIQHTESDIAQIQNRINNLLS